MNYEIGKYYEFGLTKEKAKFLGDVNTHLGKRYVFITYENDHEFVEVTEYSDFPEWNECSDFKIDDPVMVSENGFKWARGHFAGILNGKPTTWAFGSNWAGEGKTYAWRNCRRPTTEELGVVK